MAIDKSKATFKAKWPGDVGSRGFAAVPKCLITCMAQLGLTPQEAVVLNIIVEKCWEAGDKAWPGVDYLAKAIGRKNSAVRAITKSLESKGFITKEQRYYNKSNLYGLEPTAKKLALHLSSCKHYAKNLEPNSQKTSGQDGQNSSDYIETEITRSNYIKASTNSRHFKNEVDDPILEGEVVRKGLGICHRNQGQHVWEDYEVEKADKYGNSVTYYYRKCVNCGMQFHKKGQPPWPGYYPSKPNIVKI